MARTVFVLVAVKVEGTDGYADVATARAFVKEALDNLEPNDPEGGAWHPGAYPDGPYLDCFVKEYSKEPLAQAQDPLPPFAYRTLTASEASAFATWARANADMKHLLDSGLCHPVVLEEWRIMGYLP